MNRQQYLLTKLAEEAAEVSQIALKSQVFGLSEVQPNTDVSNASRIYGELNDLLSIVKMLNDEFTDEFYFEPSEEAYNRKKEKVKYYYEYSKSLGLTE